jgi:diaminohydroxyphosphoribosylaminopyrimidine deaminase/5-amino-6-(5-phosphoribosylamino)uracil reductase
LSDANTFNETDGAMMRRALALAARGAGSVAPNPMVGCVLARDVEVIAEGYHRAAGQPHAEAEALAAAGDRARGATAYVTLEPCAHFGRTPPCADALIRVGIAEVVFAMGDPNPTAAGGAEKLRAAGIRVRFGLLDDEARHQNRGWLMGLRSRRPYVTAKAAISLDGRIATRNGDSKWITGELAREDAHRLRAEQDAIAVGAETVIADDPALTARNGADVRHPLRVVFDSGGRTSPGAHVFDRAGRSALLIATDALPLARRRAFEEVGVDVAIVGKDRRGRTDLDEALGAILARGVNRLMVEGGGALLGAFLDADLIDEVHLYVAPILIGGGRNAFEGDGFARISDAQRFRFSAPEQLGRDLIMRGANITGPR